MRVGDLVRHKSPYARGYVGIVLRCIRGTDRVKVVEWTGAIRCSYPERDLEVISESR